MSRSRKKTKIFGHGSGSDKYDKRQANRKLRRIVRAGDEDATIRDVSDPWGWSKDGKHYWEKATEKDMRK